MTRSAPVEPGRDVGRLDHLHGDAPAGQRTAPRRGRRCRCCPCRRRPRPAARTCPPACATAARATAAPARSISTSTGSGAAASISPISSGVTTGITAAAASHGPADEPALDAGVRRVEDRRVGAGRLGEHGLQVAEALEAGLAVVRARAAGSPTPPKGRSGTATCSMVWLMHTPPADVRSTTSVGGGLPRRRRTGPAACPAR